MVKTLTGSARNGEHPSRLQIRRRHFCNFNSFVEKKEEFHVLYFWSVIKSYLTNAIHTNIERFVVASRAVNYFRLHWDVEPLSMRHTVQLTWVLRICERHPPEIFLEIKSPAAMVIFWTDHCFSFDL